MYTQAAKIALLVLVAGPTAAQNFQLPSPVAQPINPERQAAGAAEVALPAGPVVSNSGQMTGTTAVPALQATTAPSNGLFNGMPTTPPPVGVPMAAPQVPVQAAPVTGLPAPTMPVQAPGANPILTQQISPELLKQLFQTTVPADPSYQNALQREMIYTARTRELKALKDLCDTGLSDEKPCAFIKEQAERTRAAAAPRNEVPKVLPTVSEISGFKGKLTAELKYPGGARFTATPGARAPGDFTVKEITSQAVVLQGKDATHTLAVSPASSQ